MTDYQGWLIQMSHLAEERDGLSGAKSVMSTAQRQSACAAHSTCTIATHSLTSEQICGSEPTIDSSSIGAHWLPEAFLALFIESWSRDNRTRNNQAARPFYIKRAVEWMHAHAGQKISLEDLSAASGVSVRTLQLGFRTFSGLSPMGNLFKIRLVGAYRDLLTEPANITIDEIAKRQGFLNPENFAAHNRQTYGQNPLAIRRALTRPSNEF